MIDEETKQYIDTEIDRRAQESARQIISEAILNHIHNGNFAQRVNFFDIFGFIAPTNVISQTIGTATGNYDAYFIVEAKGSVGQIDFSALDALATSNTNYITFSVTNLGQGGAGSAALLAATDANTTKTTGGTAIVANTKRTLTLTSTLNDLNVSVGDRIRIRAAVTGTLANTVTFPVYIIQTQTQ